jgi:undecaprenyl-diphosphatase
MARSVEPVIEWFRRMVGRVNESDLAVGHWVAAHPIGASDHLIRHLTKSANHSGLWFSIATVLMARRGAIRRGALRGLVAIAFASAATNGLFKPLCPRRRPPTDLLPVTRRLTRPPTSSSFPSGHAASAAAFATAVALESPRAGAAIAPVAATVAYSRVHVGVHWSSDVLAGAAIGVGAALLTRRWWPVRESDEAAARPVDRVPVLTDGRGLVIMVNPLSGDSDSDPTDTIRAAFPAASVLRVDKGTDLTQQLAEELVRHPNSIRAVGVAGGDGTVGAVTALAGAHNLPLIVVPTGTLNHFARDVGLYDLQEAVDAAEAGEAVAVDLGVVQVHRMGSTGPVTTHYFLNTASLGCYPDLVRLRERWQDRWGKWPAFLAALVATLRRAKPVEICLNGTWHSVWVLFVGNGPYHPAGMVPAWRPRLDSGLLDVRWLRADVPFSRCRAFCALAFTALAHSRVYHQHAMPSLTVQLTEPAMLAIDGELVQEASQFTFRVAAKPVPVYRRDEDNPRWSKRVRPHHRQ